MDVNSIRVSAVRVLIDDFLIMKKGLQIHAIDYDISEKHLPATSDWKQAHEVEGTLDLVPHLTTVDQRE